MNSIGDDFLRHSLPPSSSRSSDASTAESAALRAMQTERSETGEFARPALARGNEEIARLASRVNNAAFGDLELIRNEPDLEVRRENADLQVSKNAELHVSKYAEGRDYKINSFKIAQDKDVYEMKVDIDGKEHTITYDLKRFARDNMLHFLEQFGITQQAANAFPFRTKMVVVDTETGRVLGNARTFMHVFGKTWTIGERNLERKQPMEGMEKAMKAQIDKLVDYVREHPGESVSMTNKKIPLIKEGSEQEYPRPEEQFEIVSSTGALPAEASAEEALPLSGRLRATRMPEGAPTSLSRDEDEDDDPEESVSGFTTPPGPSRWQPPLDS